MLVTPHYSLVYGSLTVRLLAVRLRRQWNSPYTSNVDVCAQSRSIWLVSLTPQPAPSERISLTDDCKIASSYELNGLEEVVRT